MDLFILSENTIDKQLYSIYDVIQNIYSCVENSDDEVLVEIKQIIDAEMPRIEDVFDVFYNSETLDSVLDELNSDIVSSINYTKKRVGK